MPAAFDERSVIDQLDDRLRHVANTADRNMVTITLSLGVLLRGGTVYKELMFQGARDTHARKATEADVENESLTLLAKSLSEIDGYKRKGVTFSYDPLQRHFIIIRPSGARSVE